MTEIFILFILFPIAIQGQNLKGPSEANDLDIESTEKENLLRLILQQRKEIEKLVSRIEKSEEKNEGLIHQQQREIEKLNSRLEKSEKKNEVLILQQRREIEKLDSRLEKSEKKIEKQQKEIKRLGSTLDKSEKKKEEQWKEIKSLNQKLEKAENKSEAQRKKIKRLDLRLGKSEKKNAEQLKEIKRLKSRLDKAEKKNEEENLSRIAHPSRFSSLPYIMPSLQIYDIQWQALHMSAAAACRGSTPTGGSGCCGNAVYPKVKGDSCNTVCSKTVHNVCDAELAINGFKGQEKAPYKPVGVFYNYSCSRSEDYSALENDVRKNFLWQPSNYIRYCCCRKS